MKKCLILIVPILSIIFGNVAYGEDHCTNEVYEIREKSPDGRMIQLEFGSQWKVDEEDITFTRTWLRLYRVHICAGGLKLENTHQVIRATKIQ